MISYFAPLLSRLLLPGSARVAVEVEVVSLRGAPVHFLALVPIGPVAVPGHQARLDILPRLGHRVQITSAIDLRRDKGARPAEGRITSRTVGIVLIQDRGGARRGSDARWPAQR